MNATAPTTVTPTFTVAPTTKTTFPDAFADYLIGQEYQMQCRELAACITPAQRRGWLDAAHYSSLPENADPEMWEGERRALYANHGVQMNGRRAA